MEPDTDLKNEPDINLDEIDKVKIDIDADINNPDFFKGKMVFVVDDDNFLLEMYAKKFKSYGFEIMTAFNGAEALEKIKNGDQPDILVFDLIMPQIDGVGLIKTIKEENLIPNAVKIVLSNQEQESDISKMNEYDVDGYIIKAMFTPSEVVNEVIKIYKNKS